MQHLEEGTIHAWLDGALSADEQALVEQHVQQCPECAAMVAEARGMIAGAARIVGALDIVPGGVIPKQRGGATPAHSVWRSLRLTPFRAAMAASLMIVAASVVVARRGDQSLASRDSVASMPMAAAAPAPVAPSIRAALDSTAPVEARAAQPKATRPTANTSAPPTDVALRRMDTARVRQLAEVKAREEAAPKSEPSRSASTLGARAPAAAPPPAGLIEERKKAADTAVRAVVGGVAKGVVADRVDSLMSATRLRSADSLTAGPRPRSIGDIMSGRAVTLTEVVMTSSTDIPNFIGCYEVVRESGVAIGRLPERFALERAQNTNVVHPIDSLNRKDTTVVGTWRELDRSSVMVTLSTGDTRDSIRVSATAGRQGQQGQQGQQAQMRTAFAPRSIRILRVNCSR